MKKKLSIALIFLISIQIAIPLRAQSNSQSEVQALERCMDQKFTELQVELSKQTKQPILIDSKYRLLFSKNILSIFLTGLDHEMSKQALGGMIFSASSIVASYIAYSHYKKFFIAGESIKSLDQKLKMIRYDGKLLTEFGGEDGLHFQKDLMKKVSKFQKISAGTFGAIAILFGLITYIAFERMQDASDEYLDAESNLSDLFKTNSEYQFNQILQSSDSSFSNFRRYLIKMCEQLSIVEFTLILQQAVLTEEQQNQSIQTIQDVLDTFPQ